MIFTRRGININSYPAIKNYLGQFRERLEPRPDNWTGVIWTGRKAGTYEWYEIQDSIEYWSKFEQPKLVYQEIQFHPSYCFDDDGFFTNNKCFILPSSDFYLLAVLNSSLIWWHNWRFLPHMKDEALSPTGTNMVSLPIAQPTVETRAEVESIAKRLIAITKERRVKVHELLGWLKTEFEIENPGQRLENFTDLDEETFVEAVRDRRPRSAVRLSPAALRDLRETFAAYAGQVGVLRSEADTLEQRLSDLVNTAYGLTPAEIDLMWRTAPPRMPIKTPG
jgi:hypothetical protein